MKKFFCSRRAQRGQASVEMLLVVLLMTMLSVGAIEISRGYAVKHAMEVGLAQAARGLSIDPAQWAWAEATIRNEVAANLLGGGYGESLTIESYDQFGTSLAPDELSDPARMPYGSVFWLRAHVTFVPDAPFLNLAGRGIESWHSGVIQRWP